MTTLALHQELKEDTYEDVKLLMYQTIHKHIRKFGGKFEDFVGQLHLSFMTAYLTHNPEKFKASFSTYCVWVLSHDLLELRRRSSRHYGKVTFQDFSTQNYQAPRHFNLFEFVDSLSNESKLVVKLALESPQELTDIMIAKGGTGHARKRALREYLKNMGWDAVQITNCFTEIAEALMG